MKQQLVKRGKGSKFEDCIYKVTVHGTLKIAAGLGFEQKAYEHTFKVKHENLNMSLLYIFKSQIAPRDFPVLYPGYECLITHVLKKVTCDENPEAVSSNPLLLDRPGLVQFIEDYNLPVEEGLYQRDADQLRQAVIDCINEPEAFKHNQNDRRQRYSRKVSLKSDIDELNPLPGGPAEGFTNTAFVTSSADDDEEEVVGEEEKPKTKAKAKTNKKSKSEEVADLDSTEGSETDPEV